MFGSAMQAFVEPGAKATLPIRVKCEISTQFGENSWGIRSMKMRGA
jgi:hypothetical protein